MLDNKKYADFKLGEIFYGGTLLSSRFNKFHEIISMIRVLDEVNNRPWRRNVVSIWCDSKAGATYSVQCYGADNLLSFIAHELSDAFLAKTGGHNSICVEGQNAADVAIDLAWVDDEV